MYSGIFTLKTQPQTTNYFKSSNLHFFMGENQLRVHHHHQREARGWSATPKNPFLFAPNFTGIQFWQKPGAQSGPTCRRNQRMVWLSKKAQQFLCHPKKMKQGKQPHCSHTALACSAQLRPHTAPKQAHTNVILGCSPSLSSSQLHQRENSSEKFCKLWSQPLSGLKKISVFLHYFFPPKTKKARNTNLSRVKTI